MLSSLAALVLASTPFRLPSAGDFTRPTHYDLDLRLVPAEGTFSGDEAIRIEVSGHPAAVVLHAADLNLAAATIEQGGKSQPAQIVPHVDTESVELKPAHPLTPGPAVVHLKLDAKLRDNLRGIYLVKTQSGDLYAVSQFEATDARRAFACYDEPAFKATYTITVTVPAEMLAISNGQTTSDKPAADPKLHTVSFGETQPISSYLVALAVGKFGVIEADVPESKNKTHVRVIAPQGDEKLGKFALDMAAKTIPFYESYFGIPYPYAKLDMVAVPDFDAGGMENAGAIFYRDTALLLDAKAASVQSQKRVGVVVVHEIAHQWFGDLVTMAWWDDLWLNEAFASLMEGVSQEALRPDWEPWNQVQLDAQSVLETDSLSSSHPIHVPVATAEEANALFDDITYSKGAAVLRMLQLYLTPKVWQAGVHSYLTAHALGNATEADLWQALSAASGKDVAKVAASWFDQAGYPLITVGHEGPNANAGTLTLTQTHFVAQKGGGDGRHWQVPVCLDFPSGKALAESCTLVTDAVGRVDLGSSPAWVDADAHQSGFYRVDYGGADWEALTGAFDKPASAGPDGPERMALLSNAYWLARTDRQPLDRLLNLVAKLGKERDYAVWATAVGLLQGFDLNLVADKDREGFRTLVGQLLRPAADELGWTASAKDSPSRRSLRAVVLAGLTALADDSRTVKQAKARLAGFEKDPQSLDQTLLPLVLTSAARHGDLALWESYRKKMDSAETPELRDRYRAALADFRDPALVQKTLNLILAGGLRKQDVANELGALILNGQARPATLEFLIAHWSELKERFTGVSATWSLLPAMGTFCSIDIHDRLEKFFADPANHVEGGDRLLQQSLEHIALCAQLKAAHGAELSQWLEKRAAVHARR